MSRTYLAFLLRRPGRRRPDAQPARRHGPMARRAVERRPLGPGPVGLRRCRAPLARRPGGRRRPGRRARGRCWRGHPTRARWPTRRSARSSCCGSHPTTCRPAPAARRQAGPADALTAATTWGWPYDRLTYANAVLPEAMIAVGTRPARRRPATRRAGPARLAARTSRRTTATCPSSRPEGEAPGDRRPSFDQQPIEVAALAEAARTALGHHWDARWARLLARCAAWFDGDNDSRLPMRDAETGGGYDGLEARLGQPEPGCGVDARVARHLPAGARARRRAAS